MEAKQARSRYRCWDTVCSWFPTNLSLWIELMAENFWHVYIASPLDMKQALYSIGLFASLSVSAELGLPCSSCICKKRNTCFCCHPPGLPRGKVWVRLNSAVTESLRKGLHRGTCLRLLVPEVDQQRPPRKLRQPGKRKSCSPQRDDREATVLLAGGIFWKAFPHHICLKPGAKTELIRHEPCAPQGAPTTSTGD